MKDFTEVLNENILREYLEYGGHRVANHLVMEDGTVMSIQASATHYCSPRETTPVANYNWYEEFEIGFPSKKFTELLPYAEDPESPTDTVYGWVPKEIIRKVIESCGGVKGVVEIEEGEE
ncbi:MAG: hypothetical protein GY861_13565 [bacterium]|nr:hypothetical protein [bacterium]